MARNTQFTWSFSRWNVYNTCPRQYKYKFIDKMKEPQSPAMARGNNIHLEAAKYLQRADGYDQVPESCQVFAAEFKELRDLDPIVEQKWAFTKNWKPTDYFGAKTQLRAILDAGVDYGDGYIEVIDHKTGKKYGSNEDQVELFALVAMSKFPYAKHITTRLWYLDSPSSAEGEVIKEFDAGLRDELQVKWDRRTEAMKNDDLYAPRPNDKCRWCHFRRSNGGPCAHG